MGWRGEEGRAGHSQHLGAQENHSRGSLHPVMYHQCPALLKVSALTLHEHSALPAGQSACWDGPQRESLPLISAEEAQLHRSLDHTDDQGSLKWCQNLFTFSETSAKLCNWEQTYYELEHAPGIH